MKLLLKKMANQSLSNRKKNVNDVTLFNCGNSTYLIVIFVDFARNCSFPVVLSDSRAIQTSDQYPNLTH